MTPVEFKDQNMVFRKPENMTDEQCISLPAKQHHIDIEGSKFNAIESVWELSPEEIKQVIESGRIRLRVIANGMPPVSLFVEPKEEVVEVIEEVIENHINWKGSTSVATTTFFENVSILEVVYNNGKKYHYQNFPAILWNDLKESKSIGQFINKQVKGQFKEEQISN